MDTLKVMKNEVDYHTGKAMIKHQKEKKKRERLKLMFAKQMQILTMAAFMIMVSALPVFASSQEVDAPGTIGKLIGIILVLFRYVGMVLLVWGVAQFVMAVKRTDAESKSDAVQTIVCAIALMVLQPLITNLLPGISIELPNI